MVIGYPTAWSPLSYDAGLCGKHCTMRSGFPPNRRPSDFESPYGEARGWTSRRRIGISNRRDAALDGGDCRTGQA
jgi:hypothetical protein